MGMIRHGSVGILPAGALGVAYFYHLTHHLDRVDGQVFFLVRRGSASGEAFLRRGRLTVEANGRRRDISHERLWAPDLWQCTQDDSWPEIVLICTQSDQMLGVVTSIVQAIEHLHALGALETEESPLPAFIFASNGIYFQRVRQFLIEKLEESTLLGRLPDLWPAMMPRLVGQFLRGVTIQTGIREGTGADAIYKPGSRGRTQLAGGDPKVRARCAELLTAFGGWFEATESSPTRAEFDKALINLIVNLLGQLAAVSEEGVFHPLPVREILEHPVAEESRELAARVVEIGRAVRAYGPANDAAAIHAAALQGIREHPDHVPSSLQWIAQQLQLGTFQPVLTPTEKWLIEPLIRYANAAGLEDAARYFEELTRRAEERLASVAGAPAA